MLRSARQHPDQGWPHDALRGAGDALPSMQRGRTVATARRPPVVREVASLGPARLQQSGSPRSDQGFHFVGSLKNGRYWQALPVHDQTQFPSVWMHPHFAHCQMRLDAFRLFHREAVG